MNIFSKAVLFSGLILNSCWADWTLELKNGIQWTNTQLTLENLDKGDFKGTAPTSSWTRSKDNTYYLLEGEAVWQCSNWYVKGAGVYGYLFDGSTLSYPLKWNDEGYQAGYVLEAGYIMNVCNNFSFIPQVGFSYTFYHSKLKSQRFTHKAPNFYVSRNGDKNNSSIYYPYVGFEVSFPFTVCCDYKMELSLTYDLGYGRGESKVHVPHFFVTDIPSTSRYGSRIKLRDMVSHEFQLALAHSVTKHLQCVFEVDYGLLYNTHKLPVKFQHNSRIVEAGQFTPSQYHVASDNTSQSWAIIFNLVYSFGEAGAIIY